MPAISPRRRDALREIDVERARERLVAQPCSELLGVAGQGDVVAPLAHPAGDRAAKHEFYVGLEQPAVVCVLGAEGRLARVGDAYPLAVADHVTLDVPHGFERLKSPGGGLRRGIESVAEGRTRHLRLGQAAGEPTCFRAAIAAGSGSAVDVASAMSGNGNPARKRVTDVRCIPKTLTGFAVGRRSDALEVR